MTAARSYVSVTDVIVSRERPEIELPVAIALSLVGHLALLLFLSVFHGFSLFRPAPARNMILASLDSIDVDVLSLPAPPPEQPPELPEEPPPEPPKPEPAIAIPEPGATITPAPPKPKPTPKHKPKPKPKPKPRTTKQAPAKPARPQHRGALGISAGGGAEGIPMDPGLSFYADRMRSLIGEVWRKPYVAVAPGTLLRSVIYFEITRGGAIQDISIERSSGIPNMDQSALRAVMEAGRLPPLPPRYRKNRLTVSFSFQYTAGE